MRRISIVGVLGLLVLLLAACGGSPGTKVTVRVSSENGQKSLPLSVAYQIEDGDWEWLQPDEAAGYSFYVPAGKERYGVAVRCGGLKTRMAPSYARATVYQLSTSDTTEPVFTCPADEKTIIAEVNYDASSVTGAKGVMIFTEEGVGHYSNTSSTSPRIIGFSRSGKHDLLFAAYSTASYPDPNDLLAARLVRNVEVAEGTTIDLSLSNGDLVRRANVGPFSLPSHWHGSYIVGVITSNDTAFWYSTGLGGDGGGTYARIPNASSDDYYVLHAKASNQVSIHKELTLDSFDFVSAATAGDLQVNLPDPLPESYEADGSSGRWHFALERPDGFTGVHMSSSIFGETKLDVWASPAWLQGLDGYTIPDLSAIPGFAAFDNRADGHWEYCVLGGDTALAEILSLPWRKYEPLPAGLAKPTRVTISCANGS